MYRHAKSTIGKKPGKYITIHCGTNDIGKDANPEKKQILKTYQNQLVKEVGLI